MPRISEILLIGHTHHDVGYTNSPRIVDRAHRQIVGEVLDLCERHDRPGPDRFRWTFEVARPVLEFARTAPPTDVQRLVALARDGRLSVTGGYLNMTQLLGEHELDAAYEMLGELTSLGVPIRTEQHGDVNGIAWGAVPAMRRAGIDRLVMALNPDHGRPPFTQPTGFWWAGPDGGRVFVWLSTHYGFGEEWGIVDGDTSAAERNISAFVTTLEDREDYPYPVAVVHAGNDNRWPTARFLDVVRHWNAAHPDVPMRTATIDEALDLLQPVAERADVPVVTGEWSDWWSHGHGSTAREVAIYRTARRHALTARTTASLALLHGPAPVEPAAVIGYRRGPVRLRGADVLGADLRHVDEQLLLFAEHTWGSWESYSRADSDFTHSHWNAKAAFACDALDVGRDLAVEGLFRLVGTEADGGGPRVAVLNPTARTRTDPVTVEVDLEDRVLVARDVPPFGVSWVDVPPPAEPVGPGHAVETSSFRLTVDPARGGVVSLVELARGRELVDTGAGHGLGAVVVERVPPGSTHPMLTNPKNFHPDHPGPGFTRAVASSQEVPTIAVGPGYAAITWRARGPHLDLVETTARIYDDVDVVDVQVRVTKPEIFEPESIFVAFPFAVTQPRFLLETADAVYEAGTEQLPDTSMDWFSVQHAAAVVSGAGDGVLWGTYDAPLVQVGAFQTGRWARSLDAPAGHINSWVMNNLHFTNFRAAQGGTTTFRYRFRPAHGVHRADVRHVGREVLQPLTARLHPGRTAAPGTVLDVQPADAVLVDLLPGHGDVRVRLRSVVGHDVDATVRWGTGAEPVRVRVPAHGLADVAVPTHE